MNIAELVVKILFQTNDSTVLPKTEKALKGTKEAGEGAAVSMVKVERGLTKVAVVAAAASAAVLAVNYELYKMVSAGRDASLSLLNFKLSTGGDTTELQQWQRPFAAVGITANRTLEIFRGIKDAQAAIRLGQGPFAAFQNMGLDTNEKDPAKFLQQAIGVIGRVPDPNIQRQFTQLLGWSADEYAALKRLNPELEKLSEGLTLSDDQIKQMAEVDRQWRLMEFDAEKLGIKIGTLLAPAFKWLAEKLDMAIQKGGQFFAWLQRHPAVLKVMEIGVTLLSVALLALAAALSAVAIAAGLASAALAIMLVNPIVWEGLAVGAVVVAALALAIAGLILIGHGLVGVFDAIGRSVQWAEIKMDKLATKIEKHKNVFAHPIDSAIAAMSGISVGDRNVTITNNVTAHGATEPRDHANETSNLTSKVMRGLFSTLPYWF